MSRRGLHDECLRDDGRPRYRMPIQFGTPWKDLPQTTILFTVFCMRLQMNHCYVTSMEDSPFSTYARCEAAIERLRNECLRGGGQP